MVRDELVKKIVDALNESGLSYFILDYIVKDIYDGIHSGAVMQAQREKEGYQQQAAKSEDSASK